ncbi:MAG: ferritin-like domain-containing protein [Luteolibacter sp.]
MNTINNLEELYYDQLRDLYSAEIQLVAALPDMVSNATNDELREAFATHLVETKGHVLRLEQLFVSHGISRDGEECDAMRGLIKEAKKHIECTTRGEVRDAVLIASANRVEHYEIAAYGATKAFAEVLGFDHAVTMLDKTLQEEGNADHVITKIATGGIFTIGINEAAIH